MVGLPISAGAQTKGRSSAHLGRRLCAPLNKNIAQPSLIKEGWEVIQDQRGTPARRSKCGRAPACPRRTTDVAGSLRASHVPRCTMRASSILSTYGKLKAHQPPSRCSTRTARSPHSAKSGVYNPKLIGACAQELTRHLDPKHATTRQPSTFSTIHAGVSSLAAVASRSRAGKKLLLEGKKAGARISPTNAPSRRASRRRSSAPADVEGARGAVCRSRQRRQALVPAGRACLLFGFVIPRMANRRDIRLSRMPMLEKARNEPSPSTMGYNPPCTNPSLPPISTTHRLQRPPESRASSISTTLHDAERVALKAWWDKI